MSHPQTSRIGDRPADYDRFGLSQDRIAPWEDGFRTSPGGPGSFEWWYFDAMLADGSALVIIFMVKDIRTLRGMRQPPAPTVTLWLHQADGRCVERSAGAADGDFSFAVERCDVRIGACTFAGDLHSYRIHVDIDDVAADVALTGQMPAWRPASGHILSGPDDQHYFGWLSAVPHGTVQVTLTVDGATRTLAGLGYHDHNWGNTVMMELIHHWHWARAQVGGYTLIASLIILEGAYGHDGIPIFMLARAGKIVAGDGRLARFSARDVHPDPATGKPVADVLVCDYAGPAADGHSYRVTLRREKTIAATRMIDVIKGPGRTLAEMAGFDGSYLRFTGHVDVESPSGARPASAPGLWELMYFGRTPANIVHPPSQQCCPERRSSSRTSFSALRPQPPASGQAGSASHSVRPPPSPPRKSSPTNPCGPS